MAKGYYEFLNPGQVADPPMHPWSGRLSDIMHKSLFDTANYEKMFSGEFYADDDWEPVPLTPKQVLAGLPSRSDYDSPEFTPSWDMNPNLFWKHPGGAQEYEQGGLGFSYSDWLNLYGDDEVDT